MSDNNVRFLKAADGSVDKSRIGGYLVRYGSYERRDLQGEYFTPETDYGLDWYKTRPLLYHHGMDTTMRDRVIGVIDTMKADDTGIWVEAQLELANEYVQAVLKLIDEGALGWSSGALGYLVEYANNGMEIKKWPIVEGSLTPTPADPATFGGVNYQDAAVPVRAVGGGYVYDVDATHAVTAYKSAGLDVPQLLLEAAGKGDAKQEQDGAGKEGRRATGSAAHDDKKQTDARKSAQDDKETEMDEKQKNAPAVDAETLAAAVDAAVDAALDAALKAREDAREQEELKVKAARAEELEKELEALRAQTADAQPAKRLPGSTKEPEVHGTGTKAARIVVGSKFDFVGADELALGYLMIKAAGGDVSDQYRRALAEKAIEAGYRVRKPGGGYYKADELDHTTQTNYGAEWAATLWSSRRWEDARNQNLILPLFQQIDMPSGTFDIPASGTDPDIYKVPETTDESQLTFGAGNATPDTKIGTAKVTLTAAKLASRIGFSSELVEDSIVPLLPAFQGQAANAMAEAIDNVLLNGDTTTAATGNVNSDDAAPASTAKYLVFNGLRKLPLVTNTANAQDASGVPTLDLLRQTRALLPVRYHLRPNSLAWIVDASTYAKLRGLSEVVTLEKYGPNATVLTGELAKIDGIPIIVTAEMGLTEADGKISATASNNTKGQAVLVYRPGWMVGFRRRVTITSEFLPYYDSYQMYMSLRLAFASFNTEVAAVLYNITV